MSRSLPRERKPDLDLGDGVGLYWVGFDPDLGLNPQFEALAEQLPVERWGASLTHAGPDGEPCEGMVTFDGPVQQAVGALKCWTVESWDPLTLSPSILCDCGWHGFIQEGRWVPA